MYTEFYIPRSVYIAGRQVDLSEMKYFMELWKYI